MKSPLTTLLSVTLLILNLAASVAIADDDDNGLLYGDNHAFFVTAPPGWVLDNRSGVPAGLHAVFYPRGSSWKDSAAVMYAHVTNREPRDSLNSFITGDIRVVRDRTPKVQVRDESPIVTKHGPVASVRYFSGDTPRNYEAVAYIAEKRVIVVIALTARTQDAFERSLPSFEKLVRSYRFISDDPKDEIHNFDLVEAIADHQAHTPIGAKYDDACGVYFAKHHAKNMDTCVPAAPTADSPRLDMLVRIGTSGSPETILTRPKTKWSECLADEMKNDTFPIPPAPDYWEHMRIYVGQQVYPRAN
jgi:hypothetical protein